MILIFIGSRANFGRLKPVIAELIKNNIKFGIVQGSYKLPEYGEYVVLKVDNLLYYDTTYNSVTSMSLVAQNITNYLSNCNRLPNLALVHGDRYENLGFAIACSYNGIKLLHTEGGEVSGNIDNKIRYAITALADIHCTVSKRSSRVLESIGYHKHVYNVGSVAIDHVKSMDFTNVKKMGYILVLYNPCDKDNFKAFLDAILELSRIYEIKWVNPNIDPGYKKICKNIHRHNITFVKNLTPQQYYTLMYSSYLMIGNTSSGIKEGAYLEIPYVLVGNRQKNRETSTNVFLTECNYKQIRNAVTFYMSRSCGIEYDNIFGSGDASRKIVDVIKGYL